MKKLGKLLFLGCLCFCMGEIESAGAMNLETESPLSGVSVPLNNYYASRLNPQQELIEDLTAKQLPVTLEAPVVVESMVQKAETQEVKSKYENIAISQVSEYVNIRKEANTTSSIAGKLYNNCAATILKTVDGEGGKWYQIQSGSVNGYIKAQYFITGKDAEAKAKEVGKMYATVTNTNSLRLREEPNLESKTLSVLAEGAHYLVVGERDNFYKIAIDTDLEGYIFKDYVTTNIEFEEAVSIAEEEAKKVDEAKRKKEADEAIKALEAVKKEESNKQTPAASETTKAETKPKETAKSDSKPKEATTIPANPNQDSEAVVGAPPSQGVPETVAESPSMENLSASEKGPANNTPAASKPSSSGTVNSASRNAVVAYAKQFLGNPYAYGGTSLTNGADCSGFTQGVFSNFSIAIGRSSRDQAAKGKEIAVDSVQPGDLLFYASGSYINHVAIYIGGGQVIHSSNSTTGIIISPAHYRTPCKAVSFFN